MLHYWGICRVRVLYTCRPQICVCLFKQYILLTFVPKAVAGLIEGIHSTIHHSSAIGYRNVALIIDNLIGAAAQPV